MWAQELQLPGSGAQAQKLQLMDFVAPWHDRPHVFALAGGFFTTRGFPGGSNGKASACNAGDPGLIGGSGRPSGEGNGNPLQDSHQENSMDRGAC